jgi:hypothetical protein
MNKTKTSSLSPEKSVTSHHTYNTKSPTKQQDTINLVSLKARFQYILQPDNKKINNIFENLKVKTKLRLDNDLQKAARKLKEMPMEEILEQEYKKQELATKVVKIISNFNNDEELMSYKLKNKNTKNILASGLNFLSSVKGKKSINQTNSQFNNTRHSVHLMNNIDSTHPGEIKNGRKSLYNFKSHDFGKENKRMTFNINQESVIKKQLMQSSVFKERFRDALQYGRIKHKNLKGKTDFNKQEDELVLNTQEPIPSERLHEDLEEIFIDNTKTYIKKSLTRKPIIHNRAQSDDVQNKKFYFTNELKSVYQSTLSSHFSVKNKGKVDICTVLGDQFRTSKLNQNLQISEKGDQFEYIVTTNSPKRKPKARTDKVQNLSPYRFQKFDKTLLDDKNSQTNQSTMMNYFSTNFQSKFMPTHFENKTKNENNFYSSNSNNSFKYSPKKIDFKKMREDKIYNSLVNNFELLEKVDGHIDKTLKKAYNDINKKDFEG